MIINDITQDIRDGRYHKTPPKVVEQIFHKKIYIKFHNGIVQGLMQSKILDNKIIVYADIYTLSGQRVPFIIRQYDLFPGVEPQLVLKAIKREYRERLPKMENAILSYDPLDLI
jgi:hypothetical protein